MNQQCSAVIMGVEAEHSLGATLAHHVAAKGLHVYLAGDSDEKLQKVADNIIQNGGQVTCVVADAQNEYHIDHLFDVIHFDGSILQLAIYNSGSNSSMPILETNAEAFKTLWQQNCLGAFLFAKEAIECMKTNHQGTLICTGATATSNERSHFTAYASAKAALRTLVQGLAREFSPEGIHVIHSSIDGNYSAQHKPDFYKAMGKVNMMQLEAIAETYWAIHSQHPSAWTHELDLRSFNEPF